MVKRWMLLAVLFLFTGAASASEPFWGDKESQSASTPPAALKPGQWLWNSDAAPVGPMMVVVGLDTQFATVYRNGVMIGATPVSTGKKGHETPAGVFTTLQKDRHHHSSIYNNAAMPYTQRLTWGGISLHAGGLPGYPSSHGCIHLPSAFAERLFDASPLGMTVIVSATASRPTDIAHTMPMAPVVGVGGVAEPVARLQPNELFAWNPEKSATGPISIVLSGADQRLLVYRNGVEIGRSRVTIQRPSDPLGTHVFMVKQVAASAAPAWIGVATVGHGQDAGKILDTAQASRVNIPPEFLKAVGPSLVPGTTLLVTDASVLPHTTGQELTVLTNRAPE